MEEQNSKEQSNDFYQKENELLKELHEAKLKRQQKMQNPVEQIVPQKTQIKEKEINGRLEKKENTIYFNQLIYDQRTKKPNNLISISSLFQDHIGTFSMTISNNIQTIFMTTYGFQNQMLLPIYKSGKKIIIVSQVQQGKCQIIKEYEGFKNVTVIMKEKAQYSYGIFHPKLWLIKFKTFLRVVISTSNMHVGDWAYWQNAYWHQDFPLKKTNNTKTINETNQFDFNEDFIRSLEKILAHANLQSYKVELDIKLSQYSFTNIFVVLIPSIPGDYKDQNIKEQGLGKVRYIVQKFGKKANQPTFTYNSTSLGTIDRQFCQSLYSSFVPNFPKLQVEKFKLIYPTAKYVREQSFSDNAETLFLLQKNLNKSNLQKHVFYRYTVNPLNCINGSIPHLKTIIIDDQSDQNCMFYIGSHNMTKAAWGSFDKKSTKLSINNCQLGILFLSYNRDELRKMLPFQYPPLKYSENDIPYMRDKLL